MQQFLEFGILFILISLIGGGRYYKNILSRATGISIAIFVTPGLFTAFFDGIMASIIRIRNLSYKSNSIRIKFLK